MKFYSILFLTIFCLGCGRQEQSIPQEVKTEAVVDRHQVETPVVEAATVEITEEVPTPDTEKLVEQGNPAATAAVPSESVSPAPEPSPVVNEPKSNEESTSSVDAEQPLVKEAPTTAAAPDHTIWQDLLQKYVTGTGKVNYQGIKTERDKLKTYLDHLAANPIESNWSRNQKLAYWINAYNAFTVELILQNYPLKSIMDLDKPWDKKFIKLGASTYSLNQIEHEIVRPQFKDARIHFALVCAATSCPKLLNHAYTESKVQAQLDSQTRYFLNRSGKNNLQADQVAISQLFNWYGDDFKTKGSIIDYINQYSEVKINQNAKVNFTEYDWTLNE